MHHNGIGCGVMVMQHNFKIASHGFFVSRYPSMIKGYKMLWNFFGNGHGKGPHDGVGVAVKIFFQKEQFSVHGVKL